MNPVFKFFSSLRLTVVLLALSMVLVFCSTTAQLRWGAFEVQKIYFESLGAIWHYPAEWYGGRTLSQISIPLPGGFLLGGLLIINLCCAHFRFFRPSWKKAGIALIHGGIVLLIVSGFVTAFLRQENYMWISVGGQSSYLESFHDRDLVFIDHTDPQTDTVVSIPTSLLDPNKPLTNPALPFTVKTIFYYPNSILGMRSSNPGMPELPVKNGVAHNRDLGVAPVAYDYAHDESNMATAAVTIETAKGPVGGWLASTMLDPAPPFLKADLPQTFTVDGHTWEVTLRARREYLPFTLHLDEFIHDLYPGTDVPKSFESQLHLINPSQKENRPVLIYMNHPLRYAGWTFYQSSFAQGDTASMLEVVHNPGWILPYVALAMVGFGMLFQFITSLLAHLRREKQKSTAS